MPVNGTVQIQKLLGLLFRLLVRKFFAEMLTIELFELLDGFWW